MLREELKLERERDAEDEYELPLELRFRCFFPTWPHCGARPLRPRPPDKDGGNFEE